MSATTTLGTPETEFGTGLVRTAVWRAGTGVRWVRRPGPAAPGPFADSALPSLAVPGARLAVGRACGDGAAREYRVGGVRSVAGRLLRTGPEPELVPVLRAAGALLRSLHDRPWDDGPRPGPVRPRRRLQAWLDGRAPQVDGARAAVLLSERLGADRWERLRAWAGETVPAHGPVSHGAPGLGSLVVDERTGEVDLLAGEDIGTAPWQHDLGWIAGELAELAWATGTDRAGWDALLGALLEGYGRDLGEEGHRRVALRIALHLHDFSAYVAWLPGELARYAPLLAVLIDG